MNQTASESNDAPAIEQGGEREVAEQYFFAPSTLKLVVMSLCTFGLYQLYWFYNNWARIKARGNGDIMPFWRAIFAPLWAYSCFEHIKGSAEESRVKSPSGIGWLALAYFVLEALWRLPDPYWLVSFLSVVPIIPVNVSARGVNKVKSEAGYEKSQLSPWNWVGIVVGGTLLLLAMYGTFIPSN